MRLLRAAAATGALLQLAACSPGTVTTVATVELDGASAAERAEAARVLEARCQSLVGTFQSRVRTRVDSDRVRIEFLGTAPDDDVVRRHVSTQGVMRISAARSPLIAIVTDRDVVAANVARGAEDLTIDMTLTERAGQRMLDYTRRHQDEVLVTTWDGEEVMRATVRGVFGSRFQITAVDDEAAMLRAVVLRSGRLPKPVRSVVFDHPAR